MGEAGLALVHRGETDPGRHATWEGDGCAGVVQGPVSDLQGLDRSLDDVFERLLDRPAAVLPALSAPFTLAAAGRDGTLLAATDTVGSREWYYAATAD